MSDENQNRLMSNEVANKFELAGNILNDYLSEKFPNDKIIINRVEGKDYDMIQFLVLSVNQTFSIVKYNTIPKPIYGYYFRNENQAFFADTYSDYMNLLESFLVNIQRLY